LNKDFSSEDDALQHDDDSAQSAASIAHPSKASNVTAMFSIDDEDDDVRHSDDIAMVDGLPQVQETDRHAPGKGGGADLDLALAVAGRATDGRIVITLAMVPQNTCVKHVFQCHEVDSDGYMIPSHLILTASHLIVLRELPKHPGQAVVMSRRPLRNVIRIAAKKKHPNLLTLAFEVSQREFDEHQKQVVQSRQSKDAASTTSEQAKGAFSVRSCLNHLTCAYAVYDRAMMFDFSSFS
jgi:hypothetical protein